MAHLVYACLSFMNSITVVASIQAFYMSELWDISWDYYIICTVQMYAFQLVHMLLSMSGSQALLPCTCAQMEVFPFATSLHTAKLSSHKLCLYLLLPHIGLYGGFCDTAIAPYLWLLLPQVMRNDDARAAVTSKHSYCLQVAPQIDCVLMIAAAMAVEDLFHPK